MASLDVDQIIMYSRLLRLIRSGTFENRSFIKPSGGEENYVMIELKRLDGSLFNIKIELFIGSLLVWEDTIGWDKFIADVKRISLDYRRDGCIGNTWNSLYKANYNHRGMWSDVCEESFILGSYGDDTVMELEEFIEDYL